MNPKDLTSKDKLAIHYVPRSFFKFVVPVLAHGANKHGYLNWRAEPISLLGHLDAVNRHLLDVLEGDDIDESGNLHLAHAAAGLTVILDALDHETLIDDRKKQDSNERLDQGLHI